MTTTALRCERYYLQNPNRRFDWCIGMNRVNLNGAAVEAIATTPFLEGAEYQFNIIRLHRRAWAGANWTTVRQAGPSNWIRMNSPSHNFSTDWYPHQDRPPGDYYATTSVRFRWTDGWIGPLSYNFSEVRHWGPL